ncbi:hypothetical protein APICC_07212 [Apis cerana cerana]|uniref:Uncharacterized protein n=1 Tax=Apis cerana cerana TaxID=94128 RepID=A0A2A3E0S3_APICC|nr:hypothetical protein APICC_07212 [Apis cerana cerana]
MCNVRIIRFERPQQGQPGITLANDLSGGTGGPGAGGVGSVGGTSVGGGGGGGSSLPTTALSLDHQQFNIFPAIFSRQLNFSAAAAANCGQNKLMDELRPNLGLLGVGLVENETFHLNQEKRKCSSTSSNEQDFSLYGVHQGLEASPPTPAATPGRSSVGATSTVDPLLGSMRHNVSQDVYRLLDRWLARLVLFDTIVKQSMDAETRCNAIGLSDGLHHFMLFDIFLKRSKGTETRCNEDIDLSDGFESIVRVILEIEFSMSQK